MAALTEVTSVLWLVCSRVNRPLGVAKKADAINASDRALRADALNRLGALVRKHCMHSVVMSFLRARVDLDHLFTSVSDPTDESSQECTNCKLVASFSCVIVLHVGLD